MRSALRHHDAILREAIESHSGLVFSTDGDGLAAAFDRPRDASAAALTIQHELTAEPWPEPIEMRVRCGIHTGEADERGGDFFGRAVNRAARVMAAANGGQIVATSATVELLDDKATV